MAEPRSWKKSKVTCIKFKDEGQEVLLFREYYYCEAAVFTSLPDSLSNRNWLKNEASVEVYNVRARVLTGMRNISV